MAQDDAFEIEFFESVLRRHAKDVRALTQLGHLYTRHGRIDDGLKTDRALARLRPKDPLVRYNLACSLALKKQKPQALRCLRQAVKLGFDDAEHMREDPDLAPLHGLKAFDAILAAIPDAPVFENGYFLSE